MYSIHFCIRMNVSTPYADSLFTTPATVPLMWKKHMVYKAFPLTLTIAQ